MIGRRQPARRGPGLLNTMARTAVIAGTATAASNAVHQKGMAKQAAAQQSAADRSAVADLQAQVDALQQQEAQVIVGAAPEAAAPQSELVVKLQQLADLHAAGILTDDEFSSAKAKALS